MCRWTLLGLPVLLTAALLAVPAVADQSDVGKWTDSQKLDDILEKMKTLESVRSELKMIQGDIKTLSGLGDKLKILEDKVKKLESDLNVLLNQLPNVQEQLRKMQQDIDALKGGPRPAPETRLKPPIPPETDLERRLEHIEGGLAQMGAALAEMRRSAPLRLPTVVTPKDGRIVRVVNRAPFPVTVLFDDMPFRVEANGEGQYSPEQDTFTYEVQNSDRPRKTVNLERNGRITLTLNWP
jgi:septal ring factor EnvC (AmiA/AmiB activator)